ncbi:MAG: DNA alkylation repair protein [Candidatus Paceibacterota bacterium]
MLESVIKDLQSLKNPAKARVMRRFFKTGKGEYGEGDVFLGLTVPQQRKLAKKYRALPLADVEKLIKNKIHEYRLTGLLILVDKFEKGNENTRKEIYDFYLKNTKHINNWDLVDVTAPKIVGAWVLDKDRTVLYKLAKSKNLWEKRIAILATFTFIKNNDFRDALKISEILLRDTHDLIHKAVGWMLREIGKRDQRAEEEFLDKHYKSMPRTALRYAIERFFEKKRKHYMKES